MVALYGGTTVLELLPNHNMTADDWEEVNKNLISFDDHHSIGLPPEYASISAYRASLGHKAGLTK